MYRFACHFVIFGLTAPFVGMFCVFTLAFLTREVSLLSVFGYAFGVAAFGFILFFPVWTLSALFNYLFCLILEHFFSDFYRFYIIILGGLWGAGVGLSFWSPLREVGASIPVVAMIGSAIGLTAGLLFARLAPSRLNSMRTAT